MGDETVDGIEAKYISGLSTIMVATIQEAKDRISQIEYIFCSQLFPNFQSKSKTFEKVYAEARLAACDKWREREQTLLSQIEELKVENQRIKSENLVLIKDKENLLEDLDKTALMPLKLDRQQQDIDRLEIKVKERTKLVEDGMELRNGLVQLLGVKCSEWRKDERELLLSGVKSLQEELSKKTLVTENLLKKLEHLSNEAADSERKLSSLAEEKQRLATRLQVFEENVGRLEGMLRQKTDELEKGRTALEVLQGKLNLTEREIAECKQLIADNEKQKTVVIGKAKAFGEAHDVMHMQVKHKSYLAELEALRSQCDDKSSKLAMEIKKKEQIYSNYKNLKSQYNFLRKKFNLTCDSVPHQSHLEDETTQIGQHEKPAISDSLERRHSDAGEEADKVRLGTASGMNYEKESIIKAMQTPTTSVPPIIKSPGVRSDPSGAKSPHLSGSKRPASIWRDTRSRQSPGGHDPHDDFLDTPIENIKRVAVEEKHKQNVPKKDDSDDETQDMNPKPSPSRQRIQVAERSKKGFKHVESVRRKAERENLKGIECKQCKKFYDAVLPENEGNGKGPRCEHHEGVSRHRYKYAPPMTPEGFWNIGFESEM